MTCTFCRTKTEFRTKRKFPIEGKEQGMDLCDLCATVVPPEVLHDELKLLLGDPSVQSVLNLKHVLEVILRIENQRRGVGPI